MNVNILNGKIPIRDIIWIGIAEKPLITLDDTVLSQKYVLSISFPKYKSRTGKMVTLVTFFLMPGPVGSPCIEHNIGLHVYQNMTLRYTDTMLNSGTYQTKAFGSDPAHKIRKGVHRR